MNTKTRNHIKARGDFQTPRRFSDSVCDLLFARGVRPVLVLEPTCGKGHLLLSALDRFPSITKGIGIDINAEYVKQLKDKIAQRESTQCIKITQEDFFDMDWNAVLDSLPEPILVIGNPPWVTSAELARLNSDNVPQKTNLWHFSGIDAVTGKSNFDISEWMLIHLLERLAGRDATLAMLCKTNVARKVLRYAWENDLQLVTASMHLFDAGEAFGVSVDACLLIGKTARPQSCKVYDSLSVEASETIFGFRDGRLIAQPRLYDRWKHLQAAFSAGDEHYRWRSGIKHDCAKVMELEKEGQSYRNKLGERYELENVYLYPMLKSSNVANGDVAEPTKWMLVTQKRVGASTMPISKKAPKTWAYLQDHGDLLDGRKSAVYKDQPRFSIFGVGDYAFAPWKVAISGLYKKLHFVIVGPYEGKPIVLDDTCYFIPSDSRQEAEYLAELLNSDIAKQFFEAFIFWDKKRPITAGILRRLDLMALAKALGTEDQMRDFLGLAASHREEWRQQMRLGI
jgi:tRNA1(Val) A37 N6-methylase TrmN6